MKQYQKKNISGKSKGQVLVLVALIFLILVAFIGLAIDVGMVFVNYSNLRRAVDAAALAGASKYRLNVSEADMVKIAEEYLRLNGVNDPTAVVTTCDTEPGLCPDDGSGLGRKLVHVVASAPVQMSFISVLGFGTITISAEAVSEAASLDVILVLDTSESMTYDVGPGPKDTDGIHSGAGSPPNPDMRDPMTCNTTDSVGADGYPGECHPFEEVKQAAVAFVNELYFPYDRVGVVTFDRWDNYPARLDLTNNKSNIINYIKNLQVTPWMDTCPMSDGDLADKSTAGPCANYDWGYYVYDCTGMVKSADAGVNPPDPRTCGATNIGAGMESANEMFFAGRDSSLWVVILLTDGAANASVSRFSGEEDSTAPDYFGYCPNSTWTIPYCRDGRSDPWGPRPMSGTITYDSADFAYDMIDLVADRDTTLDVAQKLIFSIGLGDAVTENSACWNGSVEINDCDPDAGELLLRYAAEEGDGNYYFAPNANQLKRIFQEIAEKIAFRITH
jgi:hypothetical protein